MTSLILCNCRGARKKEIGHLLRDLILRWEISFAGLSETMVEDLSRSDVDRLAGRNWDFVHHPSAGRSGGFAVLWQSDVVQFVPISLSRKCVIGDVTFPDKRSWRAVFVYANKDAYVRRQLWSLLEQFA
ncbi:hypothetical protein KSP40_PGU010972 [Platanthera guangdongensis]|uniref:Uncharacterized protein n=1 Tax=Platanthera guangdongensis TaxID=2320717 RepID=A0ABR2LGM1_9ASPA